MERHKLRLGVVEVEDNCRLLIKDTSVYSDMIPFLSPRLYITLPNHTRSILIPESLLVKGFDLTIDSCMLSDISDCMTKETPLPDGVYVIKYSVAPNDEVYVEYNYLKISNAMRNLKKQLCMIDIGDCEPTEKTKSKMLRAFYAYMYLMAAKAKVEDCFSYKEGIELYHFALKKINEINCVNCK